MSSRSRAPQLAGTTLIEVLVALALLASAGTALFGWLLNTQESQRRTERATTEAQLQLNALAWAGTLNPMERPTGSVELGSMTVSWTSQPLTPVTASTAAVEGEPGAWQLALYRVTLEVRDRSVDGPIRLSMVRTGHRLRAGITPIGEAVP